MYPPIALDLDVKQLEGTHSSREIRRNDKSTAVELGGGRQCRLQRRNGSRRQAGVPTLERAPNFKEFGRCDPIQCGENIRTISYHSLLEHVSLVESEKLNTFLISNLAWRIPVTVYWLDDWWTAPRNRTGNGTGTGTSVKECAREKVLEQDGQVLASDEIGL